MRDLKSLLRIINCVSLGSRIQVLNVQVFCGHFDQVCVGLVYLYCREWQINIDLPDNAVVLQSFHLA